MFSSPSGHSIIESAERDCVDPLDIDAVVS